MKEDLLSQGDQLETLIGKAERELHALENTVQLLQSNNQQIKNNFHKLHPTGDVSIDRNTERQTERDVSQILRCKRCNNSNNIYKQSSNNSISDNNFSLIHSNNTKTNAQSDTLSQTTGGSVSSVRSRVHRGHSLNWTCSKISCNKQLSASLTNVIDKWNSKINSKSIAARSIEWISEWVCVSAEIDLSLTVHCLVDV